MMRRKNSALRSLFVRAVPLAAAMAGGCSSGAEGPQHGVEMSVTGSGTSPSSGASTSSGSSASNGSSDTPSSSGSGSGGSTSTEEAGPSVDGSSSTPSKDSGAVSFASDVLAPIFQASCTSPATTCHGDPSVATMNALRRPYLGPPTGTLDAATIETILSGLMKSSAEDPSMRIITPGDSTKSYLMYKMDGTQGSLNCSAGDNSGGCGSFMPDMAITILPQAKRDTVRAWIDEGAPNN